MNFKTFFDVTVALKIVPINVSADGKITWAIFNFKSMLNMLLQLIVLGVNITFMILYYKDAEINTEEVATFIIRVILMCSTTVHLNIANIVTWLSAEHLTRHGFFTTKAYLIFFITVVVQAFASAFFSLQVFIQSKPSEPKLYNIAKVTTVVNAIAAMHNSIPNLFFYMYFKSFEGHCKHIQTRVKVSVEDLEEILRRYKIMKEICQNPIFSLFLGAQIAVILTIYFGITGNKKHA